MHNQGHNIADNHNSVLCKNNSHEDDSNKGVAIKRKQYKTKAIKAYTAAIVRTTWLREIVKHSAGGIDSLEDRQGTEALDKCDRGV